jgi:hypothetical protein
MLWYFPHLCGLDFNSGEPEVLNNDPINDPWANATISDSLGNNLFCCGGVAVYDKTGGVMQNDGNMLVGGIYCRAIVKCPEGVYVYMIVFSVDGVPSNQERVGTVMLVR